MTFGELLNAMVDARDAAMEQGIAKVDALLKRHVVVTDEKAKANPEVLWSPSEVVGEKSVVDELVIIDDCEADDTIKVWVLG